MYFHVLRIDKVIYYNWQGFVCICNMHTVDRDYSLLFNWRLYVIHWWCASNGQIFGHIIPTDTMKYIYIRVLLRGTIRYRNMGQKISN